MATVERSRSPSRLGQVDSLEDALRRSSSLEASAPTAFPVDELAVLRDQAQLQPPVDSRIGSGMVADASQTVASNPFAEGSHHYERASLLSSEDHRPPSYIDEESPVPGYQERFSDDPVQATNDTKPSASTSSQHDDSFHPFGVSLLSEKKREDFAHLSAAIDRLNDVAPQLHNQRVELREGKASELELARMVGRGRMVDQVARVGKGQERAADEDDAELQEIWASIERAHGRRIEGQEATFHLAEHSANEARRRGEFIGGLADKNDVGRLEDQDWARVEAPVEEVDLLTVDQFIQENGRVGSTSYSLGQNIHSSTSQPGFSSVSQRPRGPAILGRRGSITDSLSRLAGHPSSSNDASSSIGNQVNRRRSPSPIARPRAFYVAEHQEHIKVIQVSLRFPQGGEFFLSVAQEDKATVVLAPVDSSVAPLRLALPAEVQPQEGVLVRPSSADTYSFRLSALPASSESGASDDESTIPFSTAHLSSVSPSSLNCAICSVQLVNTSRVRATDYKPLPSEHWEELIGSWLCHDEMKLDLGAEGGGGVFWPKRSEVLVGGTYVMLDEELLVPGCWRLRAGGETELWQPLVCAACTAPLGRRYIQPHPTRPTSTIKLLKYALRLPDLPPPPLAAFVVQDLLELADSHRSYHFVLEAEEQEGEARLLIWLFNTSIRVSSGEADDAASPSPPVRAAKVLFHDAGTSPSAVLPPTFPLTSAETVSYPSAVVDQLSAALAVSNAAFPPASRRMMGLDVAWLERF